MGRRSREGYALLSDIGKIPAVVDPARREACRLDLHGFLTEYFPQSTGLRPFSEDHLRVIQRLRECILDGGNFAEAMFRGSAKTSLGEGSSLWATLYGHRRFVPIFGGDSAAAEGNIDSLKLELSENDLLFADFPEVCHPIRALDNKPQRSASQTHVPGAVAGFKPSEDAKPQHTYIEWTADTIVFPTIILPDGPSKSSGAIITAHGLLAASRGMKHKRPDGTQQRPDFVFLDDCQTDESSRSPVQVAKRLSIIKKNILRLGGHGKRIAVFMAGTVIEHDDLIDQLLDAKRNPSWQGERIAMVKKWPIGKLKDASGNEEVVHDKLWLSDYKRLRETYDPDTLGDQQRAHRDATEFYRLNRDKMDEGAAVAWEHCYAEGELSALQHAYNILIDDGPDVFASECQNRPLEVRSENEIEGLLSAAEIAAKVNNRPRGVVDAANSRVVVFIDQKEKLLYWMACAVGDGFGGQILDYGTWPDQKRSYFAARDARRTIALAIKAGSRDGNLYGALDACTAMLLDREWMREDGAVHRVEKCLIDAHEGNITDTVRLFCRQSRHSALLLPSHGMYVGATGRPFDTYQKQPGDRAGLNWRIRAEKRGGVRQITYDTNYWKTFVHQRLSSPMGSRGCFTVNGTDPNEHRMLADHLTAEKPIRVEAKGRVVTEWKENPRIDNDFLDCIVGCCVAASVQGVGLIEQKTRTFMRIKLSERQKKAKVWKAKGSNNA
jgi:hypothetical protein